MRSYNFKKKTKMKEQMKRSKIHETGYWPTMPIRKIAENGSEYFLEGSRDATKKSLKKRANKAVRRAEKETVGSGANYKRVFDLPWEWF